MMEYEKGRKQDVLFADIYRDDNKIGLSVKDRCVTLWADAGLEYIITKVEGVMRVYNHQKDTEYTILIDPRYDAEIVKKEIEAAIICRQ